VPIENRLHFVSRHVHLVYVLVAKCESTYPPPPLLVAGIDDTRLHALQLSMTHLFTSFFESRLVCDSKFPKS
jgi:hypothetical protein